MSMSGNVLIVCVMLPPGYLVSLEEIACSGGMPERIRLRMVLAVTVHLSFFAHSDIIFLSPNAEIINPIL